MNLIFDIDGTLVASYSFDSELYLAAVKQVLGDIKVCTDWHQYHYVTDAGILDQLCASNNITDTTAAKVDVRQVFGNKVYAYLQTHPCQATAGSIECINRLKISEHYY